MTLSGESNADRLSHDEVRRLVSFLSDATIRELALGPLRDLEPGDPGYADGDDCRVCRVLEPLTSSGPAASLIEWHDRMGDTFDLTERLGLTVDTGTVRQVIEIIGALSYARCCVIYSAAEAARRARGLQPHPEALRVA